MPDDQGGFYDAILSLLCFSAPCEEVSSRLVTSPTVVSPTASCGGDESPALGAPPTREQILFGSVRKERLKAHDERSSGKLFQSFQSARSIPTLNSPSSVSSAQSGRARPSNLKITTTVEEEEPPLPEQDSFTSVPTLNSFMSVTASSFMSDDPLERKSPRRASFDKNSYLSQDMTEQLTSLWPQWLSNPDGAKLASFGSRQKTGSWRRQRRRSTVLRTSTALGEVYDVKDKIGRGAFGTVFRCFHLESGNEFAVKTVRRSSPPGSSGALSPPSSPHPPTRPSSCPKSRSAGDTESMSVNSCSMSVNSFSLLARASDVKEPPALLPKKQQITRGSQSALMLVNKKNILSCSESAEIDAALANEIVILTNMHHPHIIELVEVFDDVHKGVVHIVMPLCRGGKLFDRCTNGFSEMEAAVLTQQMLSAIGYLHSISIVHRDLKPENFMFLTQHEDSDLVLIDFGVSTFFHAGKPLGTPLGTVIYTAPEVFDGCYDELCDVWSIGVILYAMLSGNAPFDDKKGRDYKIVNSICTKSAKFDTKEWEGISEECIVFLRALLTKDPRQRPSAEDAQKNYEWFENKNVSALAAYGADMLSRIGRFTTMNTMKKVAHRIIATELTEAEIGHLSQQFRLIDLDNDGVITVRELLQAVDEVGDPSEYPTQETSAEDDRRRSRRELLFPPDGPQDELSASYSVLVKKLVDILLHDDMEMDDPLLEIEDFIAATCSHNEVLKHENLVKAFSKFDVKKRGRISLGDLEVVLGSERQALEVFMESGKSRHGSIDFCEFSRMISLQDEPDDLKLSPKISPTPRQILRWSQGVKGANNKPTHHRSSSSSSASSRIKRTARRKSIGSGSQLASQVASALNADFNGGPRRSSDPGDNVDSFSRRRRRRQRSLQENGVVTGLTMPNLQLDLPTVESYDNMLTGTTTEDDESATIVTDRRSLSSNPNTAEASDMDTYSAYSLSPSVSHASHLSQYNSTDGGDSRYNTDTDGDLTVHCDDLDDTPTGTPTGTPLGTPTGSSAAIPSPKGTPKGTPTGTPKAGTPTSRSAAASSPTARSPTGTPTGTPTAASPSSETPMR